jgi:hypothetical protein
MRVSVSLSGKVVQHSPILLFREYYLRRQKNDSDSEIRQLICVGEPSRLANSILDSRDTCTLVLLFNEEICIGELISACM